MAYNNMISGIDPEQNPNQNFMRVRNQAFKSRNSNYSFSDNRENNNVPSYTQPNLNENMNRGSIGEINNTRNYESDNGLFSDINNNLNENSFNEQILDKNRITFAKDTTNNSIVGNVLSKRQNSNDEIAMLRPRSSKGNRGVMNT